MLKFTWQSFAFAIVNFAILAALLYKLLHKPLLAVLEKRRLRLEEEREQAKAATEKAEALRVDYERKLDNLAEERDKTLAEARREAEEAREKLLAKAKAEAERETATLKRAYEQETREALTAVQDELTNAGLEVATQILTKLVDKDVERVLHEQLVAELKAGQPGKADASAEASREIRVVSARELAEAERDELRACLVALGVGDEPEFVTDAALIAGVRVEMPNGIVDASLADALEAIRKRVQTRMAGAVEGGEG